MIYYQVYLKNKKGLFLYSDAEHRYVEGQSVYVSFQGKKDLGYVIVKDKRDHFDYKVLPILEKAPFLDIPRNLVSLARWMVHYYLSSYEAVLSNILVPSMKVEKRKEYRIAWQEREKFSEKFLRFLEEKMEVSKATLQKHSSRKEFLEAFEQEELVLRLSGKYVWNLKKDFRGTLGKYFEEKTQFSMQIWRKHFSEKELQALLEAKILLEEDSFPLGKSYQNIEVREGHSFRNTLLNEEQEKAFHSIIKGEKAFYLLEGVTGSGKTEVYLALIRKAFLEGQGVIFLVPEISLTPQMIERFQEEFQEQIAILHSRLTLEEREREWHAIYQGKKKIVLGVRSAIFAPVQNLTYIILDEEHESTYKQDSNPRYHARQVAMKRVLQEKGKLILGSATPSIESYYYAKQGIYDLLTLKERYQSAKLPEVELVDMKEEKDLFFSRRLLEEMRERFLKQEQVILLLNRKGYSTYVQCQTCGQVEECSHCSIKMSYYASKGIYKCNYCGKVVPYTGKCRTCGSESLLHSGKGVERIEEEIGKYFPDIAVLRVDGERKGKDFFQRSYQDFRAGKYQVLVGTQLIAKGLHFPNVTLVGVINADTLLNFPDFRAGEKTYQLLSQVAGRAGREEKEGKVLIQSYQPEHYAIAEVAKHSYAQFYDKEIALREFLEYPPYTKILLIGLSSTEEKILEESAAQIASMLEQSYGKAGIEILGPLPSLVYKVKDRYRYQILLKASKEDLEECKKNIAKKLSFV